MKSSMSLFVLLVMLTGTLSAQEREFNLDDTFSIGEEGTLHLSSDDADVTIEGSDRSDVHVVVYRHVEMEGWKINSSGEFDIEVENRNGDLYIREKSDEKYRVVVGSINEEYRITIKAPRGAALNLEGDDDNYQIQNMDRKVALKADDAEVELSGVQGEQFEFDIDDGSIDMGEGHGELKLSMDDGNMYVRQASFSEIDVEADDGHVDITTELQDKGLYRFDLDDGDLELNITGGGGEFEINHDDADIYVDSPFEEVAAGEEESQYRLPGGQARVIIDIEDGRVELRAG